MKKLLPFLTVLALALLQFNAFAEDKKNDATNGMMRPPVTKEMREKMAANHEKMAACLRSDKDMMECHKDMAASCKENMGDSCPMMGMMNGKMHSKMHSKMKGEKMKNMQMDD